MIRNSNKSLTDDEIRHLAVHCYGNPKYKKSSDLFLERMKKNLGDRFSVFKEKWDYLSQNS